VCLTIIAGLRIRKLSYEIKQNTLEIGQGGLYLIRAPRSISPQAYLRIISKLIVPHPTPPPPSSLPNPQNSNDYYTTTLDTFIAFASYT